MLKLSLPIKKKQHTFFSFPRGGHFHIMELRIRVNKNVQKGSDFCHRASSTFLEIRGQFSTTSTLRVSILNNEHRHLGSYFRPIRCCFRSPDFLGTDGRHLGMACRLLRYIVMIKRVTLVCKRDLKVLATIPYSNFHFFPHLLIFLHFRDPF